jgi:hypothetical protein
VERSCLLVAGTGRTLSNREDLVIGSIRVVPIRVVTHRGGLPAKQLGSRADPERPRTHGGRRANVDGLPMELGEPPHFTH